MNLGDVLQNIHPDVYNVTPNACEYIASGNIIKVSNDSCKSDIIEVLGVPGVKKVV